MKIRHYIRNKSHYYKKRKRINPRIGSSFLDWLVEENQKLGLYD